MSTKAVLFLVLILVCSPLILRLSRHVTADPLQYDDFTIQANGEITTSYPIVAPVTTSDNVTYTLIRNVLLYNSITVCRNNTVVDGAGYSVFSVNYGIYGLTIAGNTLVEVSNVTIKNLNFSNCGGVGAWYSANCVVESNNFTDCYVGFDLRFSSNVTLVQNILKNTSFGDVFGESISHYLHSIDTSNTVDGKPVYYLVNQRNLTINSSVIPEIGYLALVNSTDVAVEGLTLTNRRTALFFAYTNNSRITDNAIESNLSGILFVSSSNNLIFKNEFVGGIFAALGLFQSSCNNTITENRIENGSIRLEGYCNNNTISLNNVSDGGVLLNSFCSGNIFVGNRLDNCSEQAIWLVQSQNNTYIKNTIINATRALRLEQAETCNNTFYDNNFENNKQQVLILGTVGSNIWNNSLEGNYWSDYSGIDSNQDGIGDTPYIINENNTDHYPLMGTFQSFKVPSWADPVAGFEDVYVISNCSVGSVSLSIWLSSDTPYVKAGDPLLLLRPVRGAIGTLGFYRMLIPNNILNISDYLVLVDWKTVAVKKLAGSNNTHTWLYFTFENPGYEIVIVPEFPSLLVPSLLMIVATLAIIISKKRKRS